MIVEFAFIVIITVCEQVIQFHLELLAVVSTVTQNLGETNLYNMNTESSHFQTVPASDTCNKQEQFVPPAPVNGEHCHGALLKAANQVVSHGTLVKVKLARLVAKAVMWRMQWRILHSHSHLPTSAHP